MWGPSSFVTKNAETVQTFSKDDTFVETTLRKDDNIDDNAASSIYALYVLKAVFCWPSDLFKLCAYQASTYEITLRKLKLLLGRASHDSENHEFGNQVRKALSSLDDEYCLHMTDQFRYVLRGALKQTFREASQRDLRLALNWELFYFQPLRYLWNENKMGAMYGLVFTGALACKSMVFFAKQRNAPYGWTTLGLAFDSCKCVRHATSWIVWLNFWNYFSDMWMYKWSEVDE